MADNISKREEQMQNRRERTNAVLDEITEHDTNLIKIEVKKPDKQNANPLPLITAINNIADFLIFHRRGEGERPIFDRDDIVVNQEETSNKEIVPLRSRRRHSKFRSQDTSSSESSLSRFRFSRSHSSSSTNEKKSSYRCRDHGYPHSQVDTILRDRSTFIAERIFTIIPSRPQIKISPSGMQKIENITGKKSGDEYKEEYRSSRPEGGYLKCFETERDRYYRETECDKRRREDVYNRERRRSPLSNYFRRGSSPPFSKKRSSRSRSPYHFIKCNNRSSFLHSTCCSRAPQGNRLRERHPLSPSASRKKYSRSPERRKDDKSYRRSPYRGPPERSPNRKSPSGTSHRRSPYRRTPERRSPHRRSREKLPYKSCCFSYKEKIYRPGSGYKGPQRSNSPSRPDKKELNKKNNPPKKEEGHMMSEYRYTDRFTEKQHVWFPHPMPYSPFGMRQSVPFTRFRCPMIQASPIPIRPTVSYYRPRLPVYNRPFQPKPRTTSTITSSTATSNETSTSQEKANESQASNLKSDATALSVSHSNENLENTGESARPSDNVDLIVIVEQQDIDDL